MKIIHLDHPISDFQRAELLFNGDLLVYTQRESMIELIEFTSQMLKKHLGELAPQSAQSKLDKTSFLEATCSAQAEFCRNKQARQLFFNVLSECGVDLEQCYYDHFPLRVVPYAKQHLGAHRAAIGHHRDTWGSNIHCQQNWWAPIFDLTEQRTIAFYPDYWSKPVTNTTSTWDFDEYLAQRQSVKPERSIEYPSAPKVTQAVDSSNIVKVVISPGDVLNFSSAHLHASVPNTSTATRYSVEMRTIIEDNLDGKKQAKNIDNEGIKPMYSWFKHVTTHKKLVR